MKPLKLLACGLGLVVSTQAGSINNQLALHYPFDTNFDNTQGSGVIVHGEPTLETGKIGKAAHLTTSKDGVTNNVVGLGLLPDLEFGSDAAGNTTDFSISFWVNYNYSADDQPFISNKNWSSGGNQGWGIFSQNNGSFKWNWKDDVSGRRDGNMPASYVIRDGQWHHIVVTFQRTNVATTYLDGNAIHTGSIAPDAGQPVGSVDTVDQGLSVFVGNDGTGAYTDGGSSEIDMLMDDLGIWRRLLTATEVTRIFEAGKTGVNLASIPDPTTPYIGTSIPVDGAAKVGPAVVITFDILDGTTKLSTNTVELTYDGVKITPVLNRGATNTLITYDPPGLLKGRSTHTVKLVFADNGTPAIYKTNNVQFTVADYTDINLPAPIYLETFDSLQDGELPAGWTATNFTDEAIPGPDFADRRSDTYKDWVVIGQNNWLLMSANNNDYYALTNVAPDQFVNSQLVTNLMQNNFILAVSDGRSGNQIQYLFTKDYDLTGKSNVYVSFHSMYQQNQDSIGALEYSIDQGATWLPVLYMIDGADILKDAGGNVDAVATLTTEYGDVARYTDPVSGEAKGGTYGSFIGAVISTNLAPYISGRVNDDAVESMRVETYRLPKADDQSKVRFRMAQAGTDSWYWAIDDFGLYSITKIDPPSVSANTSMTISTGNAITLGATVGGTGPFTYQWKFNGQDIPNATNATYAITYAQMANGGKYILQVTNAGGSTESPEITLNVFTASVKLTGQWDFDQGDLKATLGHDLEYYDEAVTNGTKFGTTTSFGIPNIVGKEAKVMEVPELNPMPGYITRHGAEANGGGTYVNQYTLITDVLYPAASDAKWRVFWQTSANNGNDGEFFVNTAGGIGISGNYQGKILPDTWYRVALAVDLSGPGPSPIVAKFINGVKVGEQTLGDGKDGRWSLYSATDTNTPYALLFADNDGDNALTYVNSVQFWSGRLSDEAIAALGAPTAEGLPLPVSDKLRLTSKKEGANIVLSWPLSAAAFWLESTSTLVNPAWAAFTSGTKTTNGSQITVTMPMGTGSQYFRLRWSLAE